MAYRAKGNRSQSHFAQVPRADIPRSRFDRSCGLKTTFDSGYLVPIFVDEALPGDTFSLRATTFARMATPLHPVMDNLHLDVFFFAVPNRLVWENWVKMMGERTDPDDDIDFEVPYVPAPGGGHGNGSLYDYLGIPTQRAGIRTSALFTRAYNLIWNEWFRDQNLQDSVTVDTDDGPDDRLDYQLLKRGKRHDYFTSCLPWPQKGEAVSLPLGGDAPIVTDGTVPTFDTVGAPGTDVWQLQNLKPVPDTYGDVSHAFFGGGSGNPPATVGVQFNNSGLVADFASVSAATINQLREAFQIQKLLERDARGGTRYTEIIKSHFGVTSPDARLQRPEYLGGGTSPVGFYSVPQTSQTDTTPQGNLAAFATQNQTFRGWTKSFTEHSIIIGLVNVRADLSYQQGTNRMFSRTTRYDFYWPSLSHLGEQEVLNKEIYQQAYAEAEDNDGVFGYQERYAEYRYKPSMITGEMRSNDAQSLDTWHLAQDFADLPLLNEAFIEENPPIDRVIAIPSEPEFILDAYFDLQCARPMPTYSVPGLIDHF